MLSNLSLDTSNRLHAINEAIQPQNLQTNSVAPNQDPGRGLHCGCMLCRNTLSTVNGQLTGNLLGADTGSANFPGASFPSASFPSASFPGDRPYYVDALLGQQGNARWNSDAPIGTPVTVTYSFINQLPSYYFGEPESNRFVPFSEAQKQAARQALDLWSQVANITFVEVPDAGAGGQIRFGTAFLDPQTGAWAYYPDNPVTSPWGGDIWLNNRYAINSNPIAGNFGFLTLIHEIGHAIGLKHPGNYNGANGSTEGPYLPVNEDNNQYSIMAYDEHPNQGIADAQTPMLYDIAAIQYLYGVNTTTRSGDDLYTWDPSRNVLATIWDGGGNDAISAANQTLGVQINLNPGTFSSIGPRWNSSAIAAQDNIAIAFGVTIENAIGGAGDDLITGNAVANALTGGAGNDTLNGGDGNDALDGEAGDDTLNGEAGDDTLNGGLGNDILNGGSGNDTLNGGDGNDQLNGGLGDDTLIASLGADILAGGVGNDTYVLNNSLFNAISELAGEGIDTVITDLMTLGPFTLGANLENLVLSGTANLAGAGNASDNILTGNVGNNILLGGAGNDTLNGGAGNDTLNGGTGNDILNGEAGDDTLNGEEGNDMLNGGDGNDTLDGGVGNDALNGGAGNDLLRGAGGSDTLNGGIGDDTADYTGLGRGITLSWNLVTGPVSSIAGSVDKGTLGLDTLGGVETIIGDGNQANTLDLSNFDLITLDLSSPDPLPIAFPGITQNFRVVNFVNVIGGSGADTLTGNALANRLEGGAGNDTLSGLAGDDVLLGGTGNDTLFGGLGNDVLEGGLGSDRLVGGLGDDRYVVDAVSDVVEELVGEGIDTVQASLNYVLGANLENLTLLGTALLGTGNAGANVIMGNDGNNTLRGLEGDDTLNGGAGNDTLSGGVGNDVLNGGLGVDQLFGEQGNDAYWVDNVRDRVVERLNQGIDTVNASINYTLTVHVENLVLQGKAILGTGNQVANTITGNAADNVLNGLAGNDTLSGGLGNDVLFGGLGSDLLNGDEGDDELYGGAIDLMDTEADRLFGGAGNDVLIGGWGNDLLEGGSGNDVLFGVGGWDTLTGGTGADVFQFGSFEDGLALLTDFAVVDDLIEISNAGFGDEFGVGAPLESQWFTLGATALTSTSRLIYDGLTGALFFDADGTGAQAQVQFATLSTGLALSSANFFVAT